MVGKSKLLGLAWLGLAWLDTEGGICFRGFGQNAESPSVPSYVHQKYMIPLFLFEIRVFGHRRQGCNWRRS